MSPYTSPWSHYVAALFFRGFGIHLWVDRLSGVTLVLAGLGLICLSLKRMGEPRAAAIFPLISAFFAAAVMNHRFTIEINTFHVFCLGLLCFALTDSHPSRSRSALILSFFAIFFGVTSHILFIAPVLALATLLLWNETTPPKKLSASLSICLLFFFVRIFLLIPEHDKAASLIALTAAIAGSLLFPTPLQALIRPRKIRTALIALFSVLTAIAFFFLFFFAEGSFAAAFFNGGRSHAVLAFWPLVPTAILLFPKAELIRKVSRQNPKASFFFQWMALTTIVTLLISTKPAARYFEIPFLFLATALSVLISHAEKRIATFAALLWFTAGGLQLRYDYFRPILAARVDERSFHFLFFKDSSSDTLSKQALAEFIARAGCTLEQVHTDDTRIMEPLQFLAHGDWKKADRPCEWPNGVSVHRSSQVTPESDSILFGPYTLKPLIR